MTEAATVQRHRTAIVRHGLSQPMSLLVQHGIVKVGTDVLDYGCGLGDDVRALLSKDIAAQGWDPHYAPSGPRRPSTVVNLGFVLNVIEDPQERSEALRQAWHLAEGVLAVSVMVQGQVQVEGQQLFGDGYLTARKTFQKYYQHAEIKAFIGAVTGIEPVTLAPGIFFVFRRPEDEQDFLLDRRRGVRTPVAGFAVRRPSGRLAKPSLSERIPTAICEITEATLRRGRLLYQDELSPQSADELLRERVSFARACEACRSAGLDEDSMRMAAASRREDLLVHQALGMLNKSRSAPMLSIAMARDVRVFFGTQRELADEALKYLYALSDIGTVDRLCAEAVTNNIGSSDERGRFVVRGTRVQELTGLLRCYVGCATHLAGLPEHGSLVRLDTSRRRVKFLSLSEERSAFPIITSSVIVDLKRQGVTVMRESKRLLRKSCLFENATARQRAREAKYAALAGHPPALMFETLTELEEAAPLRQAR